jgi:hypothetical protein
MEEAVRVVEGITNPVAPDMTEVHVRLWVQQPARLRIEFEAPGTTDGILAVLQTGRVTRSFHSVPGLWQQMGGATRRLKYSDVLDPWRTLNMSRLSVTGDDNVAGREALVLEALPRQGSGLLADGAPGADRRELTMDRQTGTLLGLRNWRGETLMTELRATRFVVDEELDDSIFQQTPWFSPDCLASEESGIELGIRSSAEGSAPRAVTIEEAVGMAPFAVLIPGVLPDGVRARVTYAPPTETPHRPPSVAIRYEFSGGTHYLNLLEVPASEPLPRDVDWDSAVLFGREVGVWEGRGRIAEVERMVWVEQAGTRAFLLSDLGITQLLEVAGSLNQAQSELRLRNVTLPESLEP